MLFSVLSYLEDSSRLRGDKIAIVDGHTTLTFKELHLKAKATAQAMVDLGIKPGDRVGICMAKSADQIVSIVGTLYANAIFVPILPSLKFDNIQHIVSDSGMCAIICDDKRIKEVQEFEAGVKILIGCGDLTEARPNLPYISQHLVTENLPPFKRIGIDLAAIIYSSGSTGRPKGIMVTHRNLADGGKIVAQYLRTNEEDRIASILSFNFDYGLNQIWQSLLSGASIHLHELVLPNDCMRFLANEKITALPLMPAIMTKLFDMRFFQRDHAYDLSSIRYISSSGGRVSEEMLKNIREIFPLAEFYSMYGLTEAFRSTYLPPEQLELRPNSIGIAIPDVEILVLDEEGQDCLPGYQGELVHRGGCVTRGYWNDPKKTAERFRYHPRYPGELLVYSGDLVMKDADGYITFMGRIDGMLKNSGIRISPTEIEDVMERYADIATAVVFGIENIQVGHDIVATYTTNDGHPISKQELMQYLKARLPSHMMPRYLIHQNFFPTTGNQGKIDRATVRENALKLIGLSGNHTK